MLRATLALALVAAVLAGPYTPDLQWPSDLPKNASSFSAVAIDTVNSEIYVAQRGLAFPQPILVFDKEGDLLRSWGSDIISKGSSWGVHGLSFQAINGSGFLWVTDTGDHTVKKFATPSGKLIETIGTPNVAGSSLSPLQFGNVADAAPGPNNLLYIADGDGGVNNRVVEINQAGAEQFVIGSAAAGTTPGKFNSPHSVTYYPDQSLLFVADRGNNRTQAFSASTGKYVGEWTCIRPATPWGVRTWTSQGLLYLANGDNQTISLLDLSTSTPSALGACSVLETVKVDPTYCTTPHEIDIDQVFGEIYVACIGTNSRVMRYQMQCEDRPCNIRKH